MKQLIKGLFIYIVGAAFMAGVALAVGALIQAVQWGL